MKEAVKSDESLTGLKSRLMKELAAVDVPIVVLIDELDRVEDDEIRTVAQLVRSVADFPGISYVLAYDSKRVIQAAPMAQRPRIVAGPISKKSSSFRFRFRSSLPTNWRISWQVNWPL
ncbi:P-loop NTPase fold protein [Bradyrhizobium sp. DASA03076]|uniref:P-loop NTPase fold protein n=1 Tax=Bradyrhizobium sp. BLXBL-03 TaxID=3395916 RepID=UPI003F728E05